MENPGIDPGTSRMRSERSTIWANSPDLANEFLFYISKVSDYGDVKNAPIFEIFNFFFSYQTIFVKSIASMLYFIVVFYLWRIRVSIPVPLACEASALPFELIPLI